MSKLLFALALAAVCHGQGFQKAIHAGEKFFLFLRDDGSVVFVGVCHTGATGERDCSSERKPTPLALPGRVVDLAGSQYAAQFVLESGELLDWQPGHAPVRIHGFPKVVAVQADGGHVSGLTASGEVWLWKEHGLDRKRPDIAVKSPWKIEGLPALKQFELGAGAGAPYMGLDRDGGVWTWGNNNTGQLGDGTKTPSTTPKKINLPPAVSIGSTFEGGIAVLADGTVRAWGGNSSSTLGNGQNVQFAAQTTPLPVAGITGAASVSSGIGHVIVLLKNGTMRTWGHDGWGQAGIGTSGGYQMRPAAPKLTGVTKVIASRNRCFAITAGGRLWFWGPGHYQIPGVMRNDVKVPTDITALW